MAETRMTTEIGAKALRQLLEYKQCGGLLIEEKTWLLSKTKWIPKYFIISKGAKTNCIWNLFCFADQFANKAEWTYSMLEMESVRKYDVKKDDAIGIRIVFITPKTPEVILRCDTEENREIWMTKLGEAIQEAHSYSADSGFASGGSVASRRFSSLRDSKDLNRQSNNYYTIEDSDIEDTPATTGNRTIENFAHLEEHKSCLDQTLSPTEIETTDLIQQSNQLSEGNTGKKTRNYENVIAFLEENGKQGFKILDEDPPKDHCRVVNSMETHVKLPYPIQENDDSSVTMRAVNKHTNEEKTNKRKAVVVNTDDLNVENDETTSPLPALSSITPSESFVSVVSGTETSLNQSMSCLDVTSGLSSISSDIDMGDCQNTDVQCDITNQRDSSSSSGSDTTTIEKPTRFSEDFKPEEYVCEKWQNPRENMNGMPEGTFLIHRKEKGLRLHVMTQDGVKCFKVFEQNGKVSLYKDFSISPDSVFASVDNFIKHYSVHCIPKEEFKVTLTKGYKNYMKDTA